MIAKKVIDAAVKLLKKNNGKPTPKLSKFLRENKSDISFADKNRIRVAAGKKAHEPKVMHSLAPAGKVKANDMGIDSAMGTSAGTGARLPTTLSKDHQPSVKSSEFRKEVNLEKLLSGKKLMSDDKLDQQAARTLLASGGKKTLIRDQATEHIGTRLIKNKAGQISLTKKRMKSSSDVKQLVEANGGSAEAFLKTKIGQAFIKKAIKNARKNK